MFDFHADAVARVACEAAEQGNHQKAAAFFRSILKHHPYSNAAIGALNYLVTNGGRSGGSPTSEQEAARMTGSSTTDAGSQLG